MFSLVGLCSTYRKTYVFSRGTQPCEPANLRFSSSFPTVQASTPTFFLVRPNRANQQTYVFPRPSQQCRSASLCFFSSFPTVQVSKPMFFLVLPNNAHSGGNLTLDPHMEFDNIDLPQSLAPLRFSQRSLSNYPHGCCSPGTLVIRGTVCEFPRVSLKQFQRLQTELDL